VYQRYHENCIIM